MKEMSMAECFNKARELGELLLATGQYRQLEAAEAALRAEPASPDKANDYEQAEQAFNRQVDQVLAIIKATVYGSLETENCGGCGGKCRCPGH